jgi:hypothetical protein
MRLAFHKKCNMALLARQLRAGGVETGLVSLSHEDDGQPTYVDVPDWFSPIQMAAVQRIVAAHDPSASTPAQAAVSDLQIVAATITSISLTAANLQRLGTAIRGANPSASADLQAFAATAQTLTPASTTAQIVAALQALVPVANDLKQVFVVLAAIAAVVPELQVMLEALAALNPGMARALNNLIALTKGIGALSGSRPD